MRRECSLRFERPLNFGRRTGFPPPPQGGTEQITTSYYSGSAYSFTFAVNSGGAGLPAAATYGVKLTGPYPAPNSTTDTTTANKQITFTGLKGQYAFNYTTETYSGSTYVCVQSTTGTNGQTSGCVGTINKSLRLWSKNLHCRVSRCVSRKKPSECLSFAGVNPCGCSSGLLLFGWR